MAQKGVSQAIDLGERASAVGAVRYTSLDSLRGIAALIVVLHHCALMYFGYSFPAVIRYSPLRVLLDGKASVLVFFALSGFVLFLTFRSKDHFHYHPYIIKRFLRLYPPFAVAILGSALLYKIVNPQPIPALGTWLTTSWTLPPTMTVIAGHLAMTDKEAWQGLDNVMWSLGHEARISVIFPLLALCVWRKWWAAVIVTAIISVVSGRVEAVHPFAWTYNPFLTLQYLFLFAGGAAVALHATTIRRWFAGALAWQRWGIWALTLILVTFSLNPVIGILADCAAVALVALCFADSRVSDVLSHSWFAWLGRVSYSLYLLHVPILIALLHVFYGRLPLPGIFVCMIVLSLVAADISYRLVEKPSIELGRRLAGALQRRARSFRSGEEATTASS